MTSRARLAAALLLLGVAGAAACSLNPQPLPPESDGTSSPGGSGDLGSDASSPGAGGGNNAADGSASNDAGQRFDAAPPPSDAGAIDAAGGDGGDASDGALEGGGDASDAASDASNDAGADGD